MRSFTWCVALFLACGTAASALVAQSIVSPQLREAMAQHGPDAPYLCLITFADKGGPGLLKSYEPDQLVTPRALLRRANVLPPGHLVDEADLPVDEDYIKEVGATGAVIRHRLKWFNGISVIATGRQIEQVATLPHVHSVELVGRYRKDSSLEQFAPATASPTLGKTSSVSDIDYGESLNALTMLDVPAVHRQGNHAQGVIIGVFDNGFRLLTHTAFDSLRSRIIATHDFVDHKTSVVPNDQDPSFGSHGVWTLSTIGAFKPGHVVGPAFGASFILARTENDSSETPIEEDNWAAAIQWAESLGVQVTSTSLGYLDFDAPYTSYTWQDMNGRTSIITRAAEMAVGKGVVVVNSAGNNGFNADHNTLNAPADADSVISAGAVDPSGNRAGFSSVGPTTSNPPVIKPDVMAQGVSVAVASAVNDTSYGFSQGTSFSCPLTAGVAALIIKAHPTATPGDVIAWMKSTASNASSPNNLIGWGIVDAAAAIAVVAQQPVSSLEVLPSHPNPFNPINGVTDLQYQLPEPSRVTARVFDILGRLVREFPPVYRSSVTGLVTWDGTDGNGMLVASGTYFIRIEALGASGQNRMRTQRIVLVR